MQKHSFNRTPWAVIVSLLALITGTVYAADERPFGATDPYRPYDQRPVTPSDPGPFHEGLYLNADLGISLIQDTSSIKADPGARFSIGPGYTLHSEPAYEVGAQFETGVIYNPIRTELTTTTLSGTSPTVITQRRSANL